MRVARLFLLASQSLTHTHTALTTVSNTKGEYCTALLNELVSIINRIRNCHRFLSFPAERKQSLGFDWHPNCLRCEECGKRLNPGQHAEVTIAFTYIETRKFCQ